MSTLPGGVHTVLYALFDAAGALDREAMARQVDICLGFGARGIVTLGLATEVRHLTPVQRRDLVEWNVADMASRAPLGVTIFEPAPADQIGAIRHAAETGADWVIIQPPASARTEEELEAAFSQVLDDCPLPAAIQNAPQFIGLGLDAAAIGRLAERHDRLVAIKQEVSATETAALVARIGDRLQVFSGRGGIELIDGIRAGATGHVPAPEYADVLIGIWRLMAEGREAEARAAYARILPLATFVVQSLDALAAYGKYLFCRRHGLEFHPREGGPVPDAFGLAALEGHARFAGLLPS